MLEGLPSYKIRVRCVLRAAILLLPALVPYQATAVQVRTELVALSGDAVPDGNGIFSSFQSPVLNDFGQVAFYGLIDGNLNDSGIFLGGTSTDVPIQVARTGQPAPDENGRFSFFNANNLTLNNAGHVAFIAFLADSVGGATDDSGVFLSDGGNNPVRVAREGDSVPSGNGTFSSLSNLALSENSQVAFGSFIRSSSNPPGDNYGYFRGSGINRPVQIARKGDTAPEQNGAFSRLLGLSTNDSGSVAFWGELNNTAGGFSDNNGIFHSDGTSDLTRLVREGDASPDGESVFSSIRPGIRRNLAINNASQTAFVGVTRNADGTSIGIFLANASNDVSLIVDSSEMSSILNDTFDDFGDPTLNNSGRVAFRGFLRDTDGGGREEGLYFYDDGLGLSQIVREGDAAPDGNGTFLSIHDRDPVINDAGQAAFLGFLDGTSGGNSDNEGLYLYDDVLGLQTLARKGDAFLGSRLTALHYPANRTRNGYERSGPNQRGQVAYKFSLADGRQGIAIATIIPEPSTLLPGMPVSGLMMRRARRSPIAPR